MTRSRKFFIMSKKKKLIIVLIISSIVIVLGFFIYKYCKMWHEYGKMLRREHEVQEKEAVSNDEMDQEDEVSDGISIGDEYFSLDSEPNVYYSTDLLQDFGFDKEDFVKGHAFVEVDYSSRKDDFVDDGLPDYSGCYIDEDFRDPNYAYCLLVKQSDGTYYIESLVYRNFFVEGTLNYKSDGLLEFDDGKGTVSIEGQSVVINYNENKSKETYEFYCKNQEICNISDYLGEFIYYDDNGLMTTVNVHYAANRLPEITVSQEDRKITFDYRDIDEYEGKLFASKESTYSGLYSEMEDYMINNLGDKYLIIDNSGDTSKIFFRYSRSVYLD